MTESPLSSFFVGLSDIHTLLRARNNNNSHKYTDSAPAAASDPCLFFYSLDNC